ncbi:MAG: TRAP transporter large permease [Dorea sp.]
MSMAIKALIIILVVMLVLLFIGVPISYAIGISSLAAIVMSVPFDVSVLTAAQRTFVGMSKFSLTAIPFFILAGNLMNQGGIAKRLVDFVMAILGKLPGALLVTNVGTNALFGAISGSASAAAAAVGSMVREGEEEQGYDSAICAATNAASAPSGLLIPPSNALITYSLASGGTSVAALFLAGYVPGIIWAVCCIIVAVIIAKKKGYKGTPGKYDWKNLGRATLRALPSLSLIVVVIGGIVSGIFTATEGSAIAVVYALILGICYKNITLKSLWNIIVDSAKMSGMIVFLIGVSNILGWVMAFTQIPEAVSTAILGLTSNKYIILLIMNLILLVAGTFMDVTPAILIFTPLFLPIVQSFGMHPVQFGLILVYNLCIGNITPPVGNTLFVGIKIGKTSLAKVMPYMLMYYVAILAGLLLVTYIPAVSLGLVTASGLI